MSIRFYQTLAGSNPVAKYLRDLPKKEKKLIELTFALLEARGLEADLVKLRPIEGKLWEIKIGPHRVFYVMVTGPTMVLLHAYKKQSQKAPKHEIDLAKTRMEKVLELEEEYAS